MPWSTHIPGIVLVFAFWGFLLGGHGLIVAGLAIGFIETLEYKLVQLKKRRLQDAADQIA